MSTARGILRLVCPEAAIVVFLVLFAAAALAAYAQPPALATAAPASPEQRGAELFQRERCFFCHSVRDYPAGQMRVSFSLGYLERLAGQWGRNGPDLNALTGRRTGDWLLAHLIDPGASVAGCPMPSYAYLPDGDLQALMAFLQRQNATVRQENVLTPGPAPAVPATRDSYLAGRALYQIYCIGCHGREGNGAGTVGQLLAPEPRDLSDAAWMTKRDDASLYRTMAAGRPGTAMPGYAATLGDHDVALVLYYIRFFANPSARQAMEEGFGGAR